MNETENSQVFVSEKLIDIKEIIGVLLSRIRFFIVLTVIGFVIAAVFTKTFIPKTYSSSISLYVKNVTSSSTSSNTDSDAVTGSDLKSSQTLAATYIAILQDKSMVKKIGQELIKNNGEEKIGEYLPITTDDAGNLMVEYKALAAAISYTTVNETELISVSATTTNPWLSAEISTTVSELAPEVLIRVVGAGSVETVGEAEIPKKAIGPNTRMNALIGAGAGFALAFMIILLQYFLDDAINSGDVLSIKYNLPLLGEVPVFGEEQSIGKKKKKKKNDIVKADERKTILDINPTFVLTEAYNTFRTNLLFTVSASENNAVVFSSALPGEGKSVTSANVAISLGDTESKVLLIDADMRKPVQHKLFHLENKKGLSTLIGGMSNIDNTINRKVHGNLDVITSGPIPPNPSQLLESENMNLLLADLRGRYDYIIIDSAPINIVTDALILAGKSAGIVLVTKQGETTYSEVDKVLMSAYTTKRKILGVVANAVGNLSGVYGKKYAYKYKYGYKYSNKYKYYESYEQKDGE